jgi:hypothetical protein
LAVRARFQETQSRCGHPLCDPTVSLLTAFQFSVGQLLRFLLRFKTRYLARSATWIDYLLFSGQT